MEESKAFNYHKKNIDELHCEVQQWKSHLSFMDDEVIFIMRLLNSYVFQPNTPNLFERLQDYLQRMKRFKKTKSNIKKRIVRHDNNLGGMMECSDGNCDDTYYKNHDGLKAQVVDCMESFRVLKSEIFNYAGGILRKRKP